jgi:hypothetical protein
MYIRYTRRIPYFNYIYATDQVDFVISRRDTEALLRWNNITVVIPLHDSPSPYPRITNLSSAPFGGEKRYQRWWYHPSYVDRYPSMRSVQDNRRRCNQDIPKQEAFHTICICRQVPIILYGLSFHSLSSRLHLLPDVRSTLSKLYDDALSLKLKVTTLR